MINAFELFHPIINFYYFIVVISFSMFFMHPIFLLISLLTAFIYSVMLNGKRAVKFNILYMIPILIVTSIINPAFSHKGVTILTYFKNGNPMTLESIVYGLCSAIMFVSVILWFSCYNAIISSDKFIYLFGKIIPSLSLIISMVLRFVPRYKTQIKIISNAQRCIGRDITNGSILQKARNGIKILSIMTTWALENGIETADSMKSRGYGLKGRTSFSNFRFDKRDKIVFITMTVFTGVLIAGALNNENNIVFFPMIKIKEISIFSILVYISFTGLCLTPVIIEVIEIIKWSKIEKYRSSIEYTCIYSINNYWKVKNKTLDI
ncbi:energy-coupling factor transporter transmembrane component T [Paraclostridium sordellii]|uniref:Cobalt transport protein n=1 Tax=Paraclostridium sordellii TaxID=1505 RepID=A0A0C7G5H1_PARSO|nr:energy-coupling factor transporter transmembrane component T [Paeniclostridium sordellii]CEN78190.1 cobalt transport protein [[Clostridium] sordellii] [Paeniclostridium sordellii]CEQ03276.1 cobalt transport protein [[Clostridium] sordellii] [Paeniclostridium sordellii]